MTTTELEITIKDYIETLYNVKYVKKLKVEELNPGYQLRLDLQSWVRPWVLSYAETNDTAFLDFVFKEIKNRNLMRSEFYKLNLINQ